MYPQFDLISHIRQRPEVYVGGVGQWGLHQLLYEGLVFSLKEAVFNRCPLLEITLDHDHQVTIRDHSPGISTRMVQSSNVSLLELRLTRRSTERHIEMEAHPLYGIGLPVVNALSAELRVEVRREGFLWRQDYCAGSRQTPVMKIRPLLPNEHSGLTLVFKPDFAIFAHHSFDYAVLAQRLREIANLVPNLAINLRDERVGLRDLFRHTDGVRSFIGLLNRGQVALHPPIYGIEEIETLAPDQWSYTVRVEAAFQYIGTGEGKQQAFINTLKTNSAPPMRALRTAIQWVFNRYARKHGLLKMLEPDLSVEEINWGLSAVVSIYHLYTSMGNDKLTRLLQKDTWDTTLRAAFDALNRFERSNARDMHLVIEKLLEARRKTF